MEGGTLGKLYLLFYLNQFMSYFSQIKCTCFLTFIPSLQFWGSSWKAKYYSLLHFSLLCFCLFSKVQTFRERIVLFVLNYIIFGMLEGSSANDAFFLPHSATECAKILWRNGEAVAFYSVKMKGKVIVETCSHWLLKARNVILLFIFWYK